MGRTVLSQGTTMDPKSDERYMTMALESAVRAGQKGEVPVGAVLVKGDEVLASDHNRCVELCDPTAHAEILVLRKAGKVLENYRLNNTVLYVTAEPCPMCVSAMVYGRISRLVFGAPEPKFGAVRSKFKLLESEGFNHRIEVKQGVLEKDCVEALQVFFRKRRGRKASPECVVGSSENRRKNRGWKIEDRRLGEEF